METGKLVILSGPSGVGKDTLIDVWSRRNPRVRRVVAYTTRAPRTNEVEDLDYHFVSVEKFKQHQAAGDFLEQKEVHGNYYATPLRDMERMLAQGMIAVLKIDVQGALTAMQLRRDAISIFVLPPDKEELLRRIRDRGTDSEEAIATRMRNAEDEMARSAAYDYRVINDNVVAAVDRLEEIAGG